MYLNPINTVLLEKIRRLTISEGSRVNVGASPLLRLSISRKKAKGLGTSDSAELYRMRFRGMNTFII